MTDIGTRTYVLHFEKPFGKKQTPERRAAFGLAPRKNDHYESTARHYVGSTSDLAERIEAHAMGKSSAASFTQAAKRAGVSFKVARVLKGGTDIEYKIKRQRNTPKWCPICNADARLTDLDLTPDEIEDELVVF